MYSLYVVAGIDDRAPDHKPGASKLLECAARRVMAQLPDVGVALRVDTLELPEVAGGWATVQPEENTAAPALIHQYVDDEIATLVFGQLDSSHNPAQVVRREFREGRTDSLLRLSGVFSAVIVDRRRSRLVVFTSLPGCRSLRYVTQGRAFYLSSIDLGLIALSRMDVRVNMEVVAATVACGWAVGGGTALTGVRECSSLEALIWAEGRLEHRPSTALCYGRIEAKDTLGIEGKIEEVIDELRAGVGEQLRFTDPAKLSIALTAGVDSRAALALVLPQRERPTIETYTRGDPNTRDVSVARSVSRRLGIAHRLISHELSVEDAFLGNAKLLAIVTNGSGSSERALASAFQIARSAPSLGGGGGEIFRGFYYNYIRRKGGRMDARGVADALLTFPLKRARTSRFADPVLSSAPQRLVQAAVAELTTISDDPYDLTDLFYLVERFSRWGAWPWKRALGPTLVPFANSRAILAAFQLPAPIGNHALLARVVAKFAPRWLYWVPINGFELLAMEGAGVARYLAREGLRGGGKVLRLVRARASHPRGNQGAATPQQTAAAYFAGRGFDMMESLLLAPNSVSRDLLSRDELEQCLATHRRSLNQLPTLGMLMNLEIWRQTLRDVASAPPLA